ncbi:MAG TPA: PAS-domain containing protein, partial [Caulobacter sp.]|nr:PAS-domain containing protein [Caulobacter sp.]
MSSSNVVSLEPRGLSPREAAATLAEQNALFSAALNHMPHGLCMVDGEGRLILCNPAFVAMYRLPETLSRRGTPREAILEYGFSTGQGPVSGVAEYLARSAVA